MSTSFQGNVPVSTARQVFEGLERGRDDFIKQAVVDKGFPIDEDPEASSNSTILFGRFPEEYAVKGLVHDAAVDLFAREQDFRELGIDPSEERIVEILEGGIRGTKSGTPELRHRVNELETVYGLNPDELLGYSFGDETVADMLEEVAEYRNDNWRPETENFEGIESEVSVFADGLSGRMDLLLHGPQDQYKELKVGEPSRGDEFQASAYWLMNDEDAEFVIEYPLEDERREFDPSQSGNDFDPRDYSFDVYRSRDETVRLVEELRDLQNEFFDIYDSREKATREALKELEVR